jgi:uncharacterized protein HemY
MSQHSPETIKHVTDGLSILTVVGTLADILPALAALFSLVWSLIRIWETQTVQNWINRRK